MENYGLAIADSDEIIKINPSFVKAYYRRGTAHLFLGKFDEAKDDFINVIIKYIVYISQGKQTHPGKRLGYH